MERFSVESSHLTRQEPHMDIESDPYGAADSHSAAYHEAGHGEMGVLTSLELVDHYGTQGS